MKRAVIVLAVLAVLFLAGAFARWYIVTYCTTDRGGMEDPNFQGEPEMLDGDYTYVDNEALLTEIRGTWKSGDGRYILTIRDEGDIALSLDGETVLEDQLQFVYLQPGYVASTEFTLTADNVQGMEIRRFDHRFGDNGGTILLELGDGSKTIEFQKTTDEPKET